MVCPFNWLLREVEDVFGDPGYGLRGCMALGRAHVPGSLYSSSADLSNAFSHVVVPSWMSDFQAGPRLRAKEVPAASRHATWSSEDWVRPVYLRLAMGFTHAVFILLDFAENPGRTFGGAYYALTQ